MDFIAFFLINIIRVVKYAILLRILMSWVSTGSHGGAPQSGFVGSVNRVANEISEPVLRIFRGIIPQIGMIDISPIFAFLALDFMQMGIVSIFS